jgi:hypothetical protein
MESRRSARIHKGIRSTRSSKTDALSVLRAIAIFMLNPERAAGFVLPDSKNTRFLFTLWRRIGRLPRESHGRLKVANLGVCRSENAQ